MGSNIASEHETALIEAFVVPKKRARLIGLLAKPKRRQDVSETLAHFRDLDMRFARQLSGVEHSPAAILALLRRRGAPAGCYVISEDGHIDRTFMPLEHALAAIVGMEMGSLVSCIPGRLGYFEGEDGRWILERAPK